MVVHHGPQTTPDGNGSAFQKLTDSRRQLLHSNRSQIGGVGRSRLGPVVPCAGRGGRRSRGQEQRADTAFMQFIFFTHEECVRLPGKFRDQIADANHCDVLLYLDEMEFLWNCRQVGRPVKFPEDLATEVPAQQRAEPPVLRFACDAETESGSVDYARQ